MLKHIAYPFLFFSFLTACQPSPPAAPVKSGSVALRELRVAAQFDGINFSKDGEQQYSGFEYDLLKTFAQRLNIPLSISPASSRTQALKMLTDGRVHLAVGNIENTPTEGIAWSEPLGKKQLVLVARTDQPELDTLSRLQKHLIAVQRNASAEQALYAQSEQIKNAHITRPVWGNEIDLLARLSRQTFDFVATDMMLFKSVSTFYPNLHVVYTFPNPQATAWAVSSQSQELRAELDRFLDTASDEGLIERLQDRYFGAGRELNEFDLRTFQARIQERLPKYQAFFEEASQQTGLDWRLLAAVSYQESHWDPLATSYTGVRGMMMLTAETADRLGVENRLDPKQSILGGARYIDMLLENMPENAHEEDRTWMALAAYNIGLGHFNNVRNIARKIKQNDEAWFDLKQVLLQVNRPEFSHNFSAGPPPRGGEAINMVESVRTFYSILLRTQQPVFSETNAQIKPYLKLQALNVNVP